uniref:Uncharacterized protein n=1 Tax=Aegilops tauschii subsp. strangulata TaxID=200361 RepID=A0A453NBI2_AEGTS|nr:uncharacterized protein LOC109759416 [Aegilops tauschii subsp. strangulata]XP_040247965.1 uncharacterized protein LOC109759416 [Aegilops tauschii subsp. strangulata]
MSGPAAINSTSGALTSPNARVLATAASSSAPVSISSIGNLITIRLTRDNFLLWKTQVVPALHSHGLFGYVDGLEQPPSYTITTGAGADAKEEANPLFLQWYQRDQLVLIALLGSMTEDVLGQMTLMTTSAAVWAALHDMFSSQNKARLMQMRFRLSNLKKKDLTATEYFNKMKGFADAMASIGKPLGDDEILGYMLAGLGSEFEPLVASITAREEPISLGSFYAFLVSAELRMEQQASVGELHSSANSAACNSDGQRNGGRGGHGGQAGGQGGKADKAVAVARGVVAASTSSVRCAPSLAMMLCTAGTASTMPISLKTTVSVPATPCTPAASSIRAGTWTRAPPII